VLFRASYKNGALYFFFGLDLPAFDNAIATAWLCFLPEAISFFILALTTLELEPFFNGIKLS